MYKYWFCFTQNIHHSLILHLFSSKFSHIKRCNPERIFENMFPVTGISRQSGGFSPRIDSPEVSGLPSLDLVKTVFSLDIGAAGSHSSDNDKAYWYEN